MALVKQEIFTPNLLIEILRRAGIKSGEKVYISIENAQVLITKNPVKRLKGSLHSKKNALDLELKAYEGIGELVYEKMA